MWALLSLLVASATAQNQVNCSAYACMPPGYRFPGHTCIELDSTTNVYQMTLCPNFSDTYGCVENSFPGEPSLCQTLPPPVVEKSYPGQPCNTNLDCLDSNTTKCLNYTCQGLGQGNSCSSDTECDVGLYCNFADIGSSHQCEFQLPENSPCLREEECSNELTCDGYGQTPGVCVPYYSLEDGQAVRNCEISDGEGISNLCTSATCRPNNLEMSSPGTCISPYVSHHAPQNCTSDADCIGTSQTNNYNATKTCHCGYSSSGTAYCPVFGGDNIAQSLLGFKLDLIDSFTSSNTSCHTSLRFDDYCYSLFLSPSDFLTFKQTRDATNALFLYQDNDNCVKANILNDYYQLTADSLSCPAYSCGSMLNESQCVAFNQGNNTYELSTCPSGDVCEVDTLGLANVTCSAAQNASGTAYPGEPCTIASQCNTNSCVNGYCNGTQKGGNCSDSTTCDVGLYCNLDDLECESLQNVGQLCLEDSDCVMTAGCDLSTLKCTTYFTMPTSAPVYCPSSDFNALCASAWCKSSLSSPFGNCTTAPMSIGKPPGTCKTDDDCWDTTHTYKSTCTCGYSYIGQRYCDLFPGDSDYVNFIAGLKELVNEASTANAARSPCQTTRRFTPECFNLTITTLNSDNFTVLQNYYQARQAPLLQDNDACVKQMFTNAYWSIPATNSTNSTSSAVSVAVTSALVWFSLAG